MAESNSDGLEITEEESEMSSYKKDALAVVVFKIVYNKDDFKLGRFSHFKPQMAHQVFGESEKIFGYRSLSITLYYLHNSSRCYVDVKSSGQIQNNSMPPDDIMKSLNDWLPENFATEEKLLYKMLENEKHGLTFGTVLSEFRDSNECSLFPNQKVEVNYKITACDTLNSNFQEYHKRFETFIVWFIDAANFIDLEDERWLMYYVYEEFEHPETKHKYNSPVGFCSVYKFFAYPNNVRARISQFFVLPSHQRRGIGKHLYHTVIRQLRNISDVVDITVEEPTPTFQRIRDVDDCLLIQKSLKESNISITSGSPKHIGKVMKKFRICKKQCQRILDILRCYEASRLGVESYKKHLETIKNRIRGDVERDNHGSKRMNFEALAAVTEPVDKNGLVESEFKKYVSDIEPSLKYLQKHLENN